MTKVVFNISMSLDGYITGPNQTSEDPIGDGGQLHAWMFDMKTDVDAQVLEEVYATAGAIVVGRTMFDLGVGPWGDPPPFHRPVFVLTHRPQAPMVMQGGTTYHFVTGGLEAVLAEAKAAAGDKNVAIWGGANIIQQALQARVIDEFQLHLIPILLGGGDRLFEHLGGAQIQLKKTRTIETPSAIHLRFEVVRGRGEG